jgi:hypothetical protein
VIDIGSSFAYNHTVPRRNFANRGEVNFMAKKLKKGKKIAPNRSLRSLKRILDKT